MKNSTIKSSFLYFLGIITIIIIWIISSSLINNDLVIPSIDDVGRSLAILLSKKNTYLIILNTIYKLVLALAIGFIIALVLGLISYLVKGFSIFITPIIALARMVPVATIIIILLMIIGNKSSPYIITLLVIIPIMYESILTGFNSIQKGIIEEVKMLTNVNSLVIGKIYLPLITPYMLSGIVSSVGLGLKVMVMAEFIAQTPNTIGYELNQEKAFLEINNVFAWTIILVIFILIVEFLLKYFNKKIVKIQGSY